jgi:hypothetical protein
MSVCCATDCRRTSVTAWVAVSKVSVVICVLAVVQVDSFGAVAAAVGAVVDNDMVVARGDSGCERRGWRVCRGAVGRAASECRRLRGPGGSFEA